MIIPLLTIAIPVLFILSGIETALLAVSRVRIIHASKQGDRRAIRLSNIFFRDRDQLLTSILILTSAITVLIFAAITLRLVDPDLFGHAGYGITFLVSLPVYILIAEVLPKALVNRFPYRFLIRTLPLINLISFTLLPVVRAVTFVLGLRRREAPTVPLEDADPNATRADFKALANTIEREGTLGTDERKMITNVVDSDQIPLDQLMVPIASVTTIAPDTPVSNILRLSQQTGLEQFPVKDPSGAINGIVDVFTILRKKHRAPLASSYSQKIIESPSKTSPLSLIRELRSQNQRVACIVDARSRPLGIISYDDILTRMVTID